MGFKTCMDCKYYRGQGKNCDNGVSNCRDIILKCGLFYDKKIIEKKFCPICDILMEISHCGILYCPTCCRLLETTDFDLIVMEILKFECNQENSVD